MENRPLLLAWARGFARLALFFRPLDMRRVARREGAQRGTVRPAPPNAPTRRATRYRPHSRKYGDRTRGAVLPRRRLSRCPPEDMAANHARRYRIPPHFYERLRESAPQ